MIQAGERQELIIVKETGFGVYLAENKESSEKVLLPKKMDLWLVRLILFFPVVTLPQRFGWWSQSQSSEEAHSSQSSKDTPSK